METSRPASHLRLSAWKRCFFQRFAWLVTCLVSAAAALPACSFVLDRPLSPGDLRGTVVFQSSDSVTSPVPNAHVVLENTSLTLDTDSTGRFAFTGLAPGLYALNITAEIGGSETANAGLRLPGISLSQVAGGTDGIDLGPLVVGAFGEIQGSVTLNGGLVIGATVVLSGVAQTSVGESGFVFQNVPPGDYSVAVFARPPGSAAVILPAIQVSLASREDDNLGALALDGVPTATPGNVVGTAVEDGPATNANVTVMLTGPEGTQASVPAPQPGGAYALLGITPGVYTLTAQAQGYESISVTGLIVGDAEVVVPPILLSPSEGVDGGPVVVDAGVDAGVLPADAGVDAGPALGGFGAKCGTAGDCDFGPSPLCIVVSTVAKYGFCSSTCSDDTDCGAGNVCIGGQLGGADGGVAGVCLQGCVTNADCSNHLACDMTGNDANSEVVAYCAPGCASDSDCAVGSCDTTTAQCIDAADGG